MRTHRASWPMKLSFGRLLILGISIGQVALILIDFSMSPIQLNWLKEILHLLVLFRVDSIIELV